MKKKMTTTGDMKIASEEDLLTLDANTGEKFYRPFIPEDFQRFEAEPIHVREVAQRAIDETQWDTGEPGGENGAFPPTRDGCIHSLSMRERG